MSIDSVSKLVNGSSKIQIFLFSIINLNNSSFLVSPKDNELVLFIYIIIKF